jgi:hypothetical protein
VLAADRKWKKNIDDAFHDGEKPELPKKSRTKELVGFLAIAFVFFIVVLFVAHNLTRKDDFATFLFLIYTGGFWVGYLFVNRRWWNSIYHIQTI